jgi:hypothetical protein
VSDQFNDDGVIPSHWMLYNNFYSSHPYGSATPNCVSPQQASASGGYLRLRMEWKTGICLIGNSVTFTGWWSAGMALNPSIVSSSNDARVTIRWRAVSTGGVVSRHIIPMRWPDGGSAGNGEEDFCESTSTSSCRTFIHYGGANVNSQTNHLYSVDATQWHTWRFEQLNHEIRAYVDDMANPAWTCTATTSPACNSTTVMDTLRHVVLQQECAAASVQCPPQSSGTEEIQVDWITVENPV